MQIIIDEMQCVICENKELCSRFEPYCSPCDGDGEECQTCFCLNASYDMKMKRLNREA